MSRQRLDAASRFATSAIASASWCRSASKTVDAERATQDKPRKRQTTTRRVLALREFLAAIETNPTVRGSVSDERRLTYATRHTAAERLCAR
jgi:hypothetical protein